MNLLYSQLQELIPDFKLTQEEVAEAFTLLGFLVDKQDGENISVEVRQNRPDCLSVIGLAREVAAYAGQKVVLPNPMTVVPETNTLAVNVIGDDVRAIVAVKVTGVKNMPSPTWLKEAVAAFGITSISLLVDLSNYVMMMSGYPSHMFDASKITGTLTWRPAKTGENIITLDETELILTDQLVIADDVQVQTLAGIIGGRDSGVSLETTEIVLEMALYNPTTIRRNSRDLNTITQASLHLDKEQDAVNMPWAINWLLSLIIEHAGGKVAESYNYLNPYYTREIPVVKFRPDQPSLVAGIDITPEQSLDALQRLRFSVDSSNDIWQVQAPTDRFDVTIEEDVTEEVVRLVGYNTIPHDITPLLSVAPDITSSIVTASEAMRDILISQGWDEVRSWPLVSAHAPEQYGYSNSQPLVTENTVNEEFPALRQTLLGGLTEQAKTWQELHVQQVQIFEIGRVFSVEQEEEALGLLLVSEQPALSTIQQTIEKLVRLHGVSLSYKSAERIPRTANAHACWDLYIGEVYIGIMFKYSGVNQYGAELYLERLLSLESEHADTTVELEQKLIVLDENIAVSASLPPTEVLQNIRTHMTNPAIWDVQLVDQYQIDETTTRYTYRVVYKGLSDQEAKALHSQFVKNL